MPSAARGMKANGTKTCQEVEGEFKDFVSVESSEGILHVKIGGRCAPIHLSFPRACVVWPHWFLERFGDGFQTQKKKKSWVSGQVRAERVLADATTIDGRKECTCKFCSETNVWTR